MNSPCNISLVAVVVLLSVSFASVSSAKGRWHAAKTRLAAELKKDLAKERLATLRMATGLKELRQNPRAFLSSQIQTWRANAAANRAARRAEDAARYAELQRVCREKSTLAFARWCSRFELSRASRFAMIGLIWAAVICPCFDTNPTPTNEIEAVAAQYGAERTMVASPSVAIEQQDGLMPISLLLSAVEEYEHVLLGEVYDSAVAKYEQSDNTNRLAAATAAILLKKMVGTAGADSNGLTPVFWAKLSGSETVQALVEDETGEIYLSEQDLSLLEQALQNVQ